MAAIRPNLSGTGKVDIWTRDTTYTARNVELRAFLQDAFDIQKNLIYGLPAWALSARWDVDAKVIDLTVQQMRELPEEERRAMLRRLLEERFALRWHKTTQTLPVFSLVVDKSGAKIQHTTPEQAAGGGDGSHVRNGELGIQNVTLATFCKVLADQLDKPVIDRTGLTGNYTLMVHFTPENAIAKAGDAGLPADAPPPLFTALAEQLGLRLEAGKGPVQTLVVDSLQPPSEN